MQNSAFYYKISVQNHDFGHCGPSKNTNYVTLPMPVTQLKNLLESGRKGGSEDSLEGLVQRARDMQDLTVFVQGVLPAELADNLLAASLRDDGEMVLICRSSAWASRLRFETDELLAAAINNGVKATSCRVTVSHTDNR